MRRLAAALGMFTLLLLISTAHAGPDPKLQPGLKIRDVGIAVTAKEVITQAELRISPAQVGQDPRLPRIYWSNGKPGTADKLNTTMLLKGGALQNFSPIQDPKNKMNNKQASYTPRRWYSNGKKGNLAQLNIPMLIKGGALAKPSAIQEDRNPIKKGADEATGVVRRWYSNGKKANLGQLNIPMLIKGGNLGRISPMDDEGSIRVNRTQSRPQGARRPGMIKPKVFEKPPRDLNHSRALRREQLGRFCTGRGCER